MRPGRRRVVNEKWIELLAEGRYCELALSPDGYLEMPSSRSRTWINSFARCNVILRMSLAARNAVDEQEAEDENDVVIGIRLGVCSCGCNCRIVYMDVVGYTRKFKLN